MKKKILMGSFAAVILLVGAICYFQFSKQADPKQELLEKIASSTSVLFEYRDGDLGGLIRLDEPRYITSSFPLSMILEESGEEVTEWVYRLLFNSPALTRGTTEEIEVLVGENALSIQGNSYGSPSGDFSMILTWFKNKYDYYVDNYECTVIPYDWLGTP